MLYQFFIKVPNKILSSNGLDTLISNYISYFKKLHGKNSMKIVGEINLTIGIDGDDFVRDRSSIRLVFNLFKVPRIFNKFKSR